MGLRSYTTPADGAEGSLLISESQKGDAENQGPNGPKGAQHRWSYADNA